jgi:SAM-dependent methyltransferase
MPGRPPVEPGGVAAFPSFWYESAGPDHFWMQWRFAAFLRQASRSGAPLDRPLRALEVGGGAGTLRGQVERRTSWTVDLTDLNPEALRRVRPGRGEALRYDILDRDPVRLARYDVLLLFDILEHVAETGPFLRAAVDHLKPGGHVFVNVPALEGLRGVYDRAAGHLRRYDRGTLAAELRGLPVEILDSRYWGFGLLPLAALRNLLLRGERDDDAAIRRGFAPPGPLLHAALKAWMRLELAVLPRPPLGTSVLLAARRVDRP